MKNVTILIASGAWKEKFFVLFRSFSFKGLVVVRLAPWK